MIDSSINPSEGVGRTVVEHSFHYEDAFSRNIGWLTHEEQQKLRSSRVAIGGLGGVGGAHLITLTRLGIGKFSISDFDEFSLHNFNRQVGAGLSSIGKTKIGTMIEMARNINPELEISSLPNGVHDGNLDEFLAGVDLYVDGIDFFAIDARRKIFAACHKKGIPALTAAPLGMGVSLLYFSSTGMSFEEYFRLDGHNQDEQYLRFIAGLSPSMLQRSYLAVPESVNFKMKIGPSLVVAVELCAGFLGTEAVKVLLNRGQLRAAPWSFHFDAYRHQWKSCWRPFGNSNPLQWLLIQMIRAKVNPASSQTMQD